MNIFETSITQELIYQFWQLDLNTNLPVSIYQSTDEKTNGNDLEICIQTPRGYLIVACQAKIVDKNSKYRHITHKANGNYQIDQLLDYCARIKGLPMYLFYNYHDDDYENKWLEKQHKLRIQELGCSFYPAAKLKKTYWRSYTTRQSIPGFYRLHSSIAMPFSRIFCTVGTSKILEELETPLSQVHFYTDEELRDSERWRSLVPAAAIGRVSNLSRNQETEQPKPEEPPMSYNPKFRVLLSAEKRRARLISNATKK